MHSVFFYGLFMDPKLLADKGLEFKVVTQAFAEGYGLRIGERATLVKAMDERAYGVVMEMPEQALHALYAASSVADYESVSMVVTDAHGQQVETRCYMLPESKLAGSNAEYARALAAVARKSGLPKAYVTEIERWSEPGTNSKTCD